MIAFVGHGLSALAAMALAGASGGVAPTYPHERYMPPSGGNKKASPTAENRKAKRKAQRIARRKNRGK